MDLQIRGNGVSVTDDLREFAERKADRLERMIDKIDDAKLELRHNRAKTGPHTITAQFTVQSGRTVLRAEESDPDARAAIDRAITKLSQQVRKVHSKRSQSKRAGVATIRTAETPVFIVEALPEPEDGLDEEEREELLNGVVRTKRFSMKPMDVEEAIEQMELLGHDFFLFHNATEDSLAVVYRRKRGDYGLLLPSRG
ncbi:MAG: ribosome-associated translation inhibitor RaiA [Thermomicrobiales bacterium]|nr:ribosome-associated translation inhibitor RaiA [Thermomicrobiales bacterium]